MQILVFVSLCVLAAVAAAPNPSPYIVQYYNENDGSGFYRFGFVLSDGTLREEIGELVNRGLENEHISVRGKYEHVGPDNVKYTVRYKSDENGYDPDIEEGPGVGVSPVVVASLLG